MKPSRSFLCLAALLSACVTGTMKAAEPFRDPSLPIEKRVENLVSLLNLDEKIAMLGQVQPAIPRLNMKAFTNFTEGLHGLGWARGGNLTATQFPQSVGLGETWDPELLRQVGAVEGYEARVYFQRFNGTRVGLAIRTPNVDLTRDPRWGRSEESFGEDPFHVGTMAVGLIKGGKVKAIAHTGKGRLNSLPDIPPVSDTLPGFEAYEWNGVFVPHGTPAPIVQKLNAGLNDTLRSAFVQERFGQLNIDTRITTPEEFRSFVQEQMTLWSKVVKDANIRLG